MATGSPEECLEYLSIKKPSDAFFHAVFGMLLSWQLHHKYNMEKIVSDFILFYLV